MMERISLTIVPILLLSQRGQAIELVISRCSGLQALRISAAFMQIWILALLFPDLFCYFIQAVADHDEVL
tara:strand:+ start:1251 stop:1460 length:210 start_codon:yes stop_codon:yes gene_type:complete